MHGTKDGWRGNGFLSRVLDVVEAPLAITDARGTVEFVNEAAARSPEWPGIGAVGHHILNVVPVVTEDHVDVLERQLLTGQTWSGEVLLRRSDGSTYPATVTASPLLDDAGAMTHVVVVCRDISELSSLQRRLRVSFDAARHGWAFADLFGAITEVNAAFCEIVGRARDDLVGRRPHDFTLDDDRERLTPFDDMRAGRHPDEFHTQKRYVHDDGTIRWVDVHVNLVRDHAGRPEYFVAHVHDITGWVSAEREAVEAETKYRELFTSIVLSIGTALELRDPYTAGHQRRVAALSVAIADHLGLDEATREGLQVGAGLHDMGKVATPAEILTKPGRLDDAEYAIVQRHPRAGHDIVAGIAFPWPVATMIRQHHERLDGSGYPDGLRGDAIGLEAKIIAVADTVETIVSTRPYRPASPLSTALQVIDDARGTLFDPDVVSACVRAFDAGFDLDATHL